MSIRGERAKAEECAREARAERESRRRHTANALSIVRRRISSPLGLAACFGAGVIAGWRGGSGGDDGSEGEQSFMERVSGSSLSQIVMRVALASAIRSWIQPEAAADASEAGESVTDTFQNL